MRRRGTVWSWQRRPAVRLAAGAALVQSLLLGACSRGQDGFVAPPPPEVTVARPIEREVAVDMEATGRVTGRKTVEVRARVKGFVERVHFQAGSTVREGDLLFTIDPRPFRARLAQADADLAGRVASLGLAESNLAKARALSKSQVLAVQDLDTRIAERDQEAAGVAGARANGEAARLELSYTEVHAPIAGRIGRTRVDQGALVGANDATLLATIVNDVEVYVYFDVSERQLLDYLRANPQARQGSDGGPAAGSRGAAPRQPVLVARADEDGFVHPGWIDSADNQVDAQTGTLRIRAVVANPDRAIVPGTFVRVRVPVARETGLLVPDVAVGSDQAGRYVLVVDEQGIVERRAVRVGPASERLRRVLSGVEPEQWVVVNGLQRARPGAKVTPLRSTVDAQGQATPGAAG